MERRGSTVRVRQSDSIKCLQISLTRRVDFALFMVDALENDELIHEVPAIVGRQTASALAHAAND
jgi:hypothetical protein